VRALPVTPARPHNALKAVPGHAWDPSWDGSPEQRHALPLPALDRPGPTDDRGAVSRPGLAEHY